MLRARTVGRSRMRDSSTTRCRVLGPRRRPAVGEHEAAEGHYAAEAWDAPRRPWTLHAELEERAGRLGRAAADRESTSSDVGVAHRRPSLVHVVVGFVHARP